MPPVGLMGPQRARIEAINGVLAAPAAGADGATELTHDARNMVTALELYCDLLEEPGVLNPQFSHYGSELRLLASASRRLVDKLMALDPGEHVDRVLGADPGRRVSGAAQPACAARQPIAGEPIADLAGEVSSVRSLLAALAGPAISVTADSGWGALPVNLTREDLTRVLVNLVRNAAEAMPAGGRIAISIDEFHAGTGPASWLVLSVEDTGPGIVSSDLERVFDTGYSTHTPSASSAGPPPKRGLGLAICQSIVTAAGGQIRAVQRPQGAHRGARFEIELPVRAC